MAEGFQSPGNQWETLFQPFCVLFVWKKYGISILGEDNVYNSKQFKSYMVKAVQQNDRQDLSSILSSEIFVNFRSSEKDSVMARTGILQIRKGGFLFPEGKVAGHFYFLLRGAVRICKSQNSGPEGEIAVFTSGDMIGEFDFARGAKYDAFAEAVEDSALVVFPGSGQSMEKIALEEPIVYSKILFNSVAMVTKRIKSTRKLIIESSYWVKELYRKIHEDPGTGLWKQTFMNEEINQLLEDPMTLIMLKPDRFKIFVDTLGHGAGDQMMIKFAAILKDITRKLEKGWPMRFKSNEMGILINKCSAAEAASIAQSIASAMKKLTPVAISKDEDFSFTATVCWGVWPEDNKSWDSLFDGIYKSLLDLWKEGGNRVVRYSERISHE